MNRCSPLLQKSNAYSGIESILPLEFIQFLQAIGKATPELFSPRVRAADCKELLSDLQNVFSAWTRIKKMRESSRIWSEADYVANVYAWPPYNVPIAIDRLPGTT